jgi:hypothetical protein
MLKVKVFVGAAAVPPITLMHWKFTKGCEVLVLLINHPIGENHVLI